MKSNYHTHTPRCRHAAGNDRAYVEAALSAKFDVLGISDHTPWPYLEPQDHDIRMDVGELPGYVASLRGLSAEYGDSIKILLGLECEYYPDHMSWLKETMEQYSLDYAILGAHFFGSDPHSPYTGSACAEDRYLSRYMDMCAEALETGVYAYFAHPDICFRARNKWDDQCRAAADGLCQAARDSGIPLEYNLNGDVIQRRQGDFHYPRREFWERVALHGNKVILGYDAHDPALLTDEAAAAKALGFLAEMGITPLESLPLERP